MSCVSAWEEAHDLERVVLMMYGKIVPMSLTPNPTIRIHRHGIRRKS